MTTTKESSLNSEQTSQFVDRFWEEQILPTLSSYIEIPNQSILFDPEWKKNGHMDRAVALVREWVEKQNISGLRLEVIEDTGRTPVILIEVDGANDDTILLYGHLDKQPAMVGWDKELGPWKPVRRGDKLFGRGGADDGYAVFSIISMVKALQEQKIPHARLVALIETCEESGSLDLPHYVEKFSGRIGTPSLVICLDSGCGNYDRLWLTTTLRGAIVGNLTVDVLTEGVHSGDASGIVPSSFRILRVLLDRLEDAKSGELIPEWMSIDVPPHRMEQIRQTAEIMGDNVWSQFPFVEGMTPLSKDPVELIINRTWKPTVCYTGQAGMPDLVQGGNVLRPQTSLKLSIRIPPGVDADTIETKLTELLTSDPPYGAKVTLDLEKGASGWEAPKTVPWLARSLDAASNAFFGHSVANLGEGGSIPFMGMLGEKFPEAQFVVTGVLGPYSNAHGPNEFLHIPMAKKVSMCMARVVADAFEARSAR
ncbi:MAG: M20 family metallopeptidase [Thermoanaerobaculia bacterium]